MKIVWIIWILIVFFCILAQWKVEREGQKRAKDNQKYIDAGVLMSVVEEGSNIIYYYDYYGNEIMELRRGLNKGKEVKVNGNI